MTRRERLSIIFNQFDKSAKEFCDDAGGLFCETNAEYKGIELPENLKYRCAKIFFNAFVVEFKYTAHTSLGFVHSVLESIIFPGKTEDTVGIPMPFVADYLDKDVLPPVIPFVSDKEGMKQAFCRMGGILKDMLADISDIALDADKKNNLFSFYYGELNSVFNLRPDENAENRYTFYNSEAYYRFITTRFSSNAFIQLMKGNKEKAIIELSKCKKTFGYEKRVLRLLKEEKTPSFSDISAAIKNLDIYGKSGAQKVDFKELFAMFVSWFILGAGAAVVYAVIFLASYFLTKQGAVYLMGAIYNLPYCILGGFLTGIAASYFTRLRFYKLLFKKDYERYEKLDHIANGAKSDRIMRFFLSVIVICSLIGCVLFSNQDIKFSKDGFTDNSELFILAGKYYEYSEIERIYYLPDRVNGFGETLNFPSYVMVLKDGREIDFYEYDEIENYETKLFDFLQQQGVNIQKQ